MGFRGLSSADGFVLRRARPRDRSAVKLYRPQL